MRVALLAVALLAAAAAPSADAAVPQPAACGSSQLTITRSGSDGAGGHEGLVLRFTNHGPPCLLRGYPLVEGVRADGRVVAPVPGSAHGYLGGSTWRTAPVLLRRGQMASALVEGLSARADDGPPCPTYTALRVAPRQGTQAVQLPVRHAFCDPTVHRFVAGSGGGGYGTYPPSDG